MEFSKDNAIILSVKNNFPSHIENFSHFTVLHFFLAKYHFCSWWVWDFCDVVLSRLLHSTLELILRFLFSFLFPFGVEICVNRKIIFITKGKENWCHEKFSLEDFRQVVSPKWRRMQRFFFDFFISSQKLTRQFCKMHDQAYYFMPQLFWIGTKNISRQPRTF